MIRQNSPERRRQDLNLGRESRLPAPESNSGALTWLGHDGILGTAPPPPLGLQNHGGGGGLLA